MNYGERPLTGPLFFIRKVLYFLRKTYILRNSINKLGDFTVQKVVQQFDRRTFVNDKGHKIYSRDPKHFDGVMEKAERLLTRLRPLAKPGVCVQAGGWTGAYPIVLGNYFGSVVCFEPERHNFALLKFNTANVSNIVSIHNSALNDSVCNRHLQVSRSTLAHKLLQSPGSTKCVSIDSLNLPSCSTIVLDIEGSEVFALKGAANTIKQHRPIVVVDSKVSDATYFDVKKLLTEYVLFDNSGSEKIMMHYEQAYWWGYYDR